MQSIFKMQCKNDAYRYYTGKEPSPKGLGWCAHNMRIGTKKRGRDKKMWIVVRIRANERRWARVVDAKKKNEKNLVSAKIAELKRNGFPQKQAVAIALRMKAAGKLGKKK